MKQRRLTGLVRFLLVAALPLVEGARIRPPDEEWWYPTPAPSWTLYPSATAYPSVPKVCKGPTACADGTCGDCKQEKTSTGCLCDGCQCVVCKADPFCCAKEWDHFCVSHAHELCTCIETPPTLSPTNEPYDFNLFFTLSDENYYSGEDEVSGIYAASIEGRGVPVKLLPSPSRDGKMIGLTSSLCGGRDVLYWGTTYGNVFYANRGESASSYRLYRDLRTKWNDQVGTILDVAVSEDSGDMLLGTNDGLFLVALDGTSEHATKLDTGDIPVVEIDPTTGNAYYGGRNYEYDQGFVKVIRPPFGSESPRTIYSQTTYYGYKVFPHAIAIDPDSGYLYVVDRNNVYRALVDGTSDSLQIIYRQGTFGRYRNEIVRTIDVYMDQLFIGVFSQGYGSNSSIWTASPNGYSTPTMLYNVTVPRSSRSGIKGLLVRDCGAPTASPTPCDPEKSETTQVFPLSATAPKIPMGLQTIPLVFNVGWPREKMSSITIDIEANQGTSREPAWSLMEQDVVVDVDSWTDGTYVHLFEFSDYGTFRWSVSVTIVGNACLGVDTTEFQEFTLMMEPL